MNQKILKNPDLASFLVLFFITVGAVIYGLFKYQNTPKDGTYLINELAKIPYQLSQPDEVITLPGKLTEISGLSYWGNNQLLTIQDEDGKVFIFDLDKKTVVEEFKFGKDRDYEGVTHLDSTIFVLERDGDMHQINYRAGTKEYQSLKLETSFKYDNDTEGICYDPVTKRLLIAPKEEQLGPLKSQPHIKSVYALKGVNGEVDFEHPIVSINQFELGEIIYGKRKRYDMKPSGVTVHPQTGHLYVLSSVGKLLVVVDRDNKLIQVERLDARTFPQPEGITFTTDGRLIISSEGKGKKPIIAVFRKQ